MAAALVAVLAIVLLFRGRSQPQLSSVDESREARVPRTDTTAFVIVSSSCAGCTNATKVDALRSAHQDFHVSPTRRTVGVAIDEDITKGVELLERYGRFDELVLGGSWTNLAVLHHVWSDSMALPAVPQMVVVERQFQESRGRILLLRENVLQRSYGLDDMRSTMNAVYQADGGPNRPRP